MKTPDEVIEDALDNIENEVGALYVAHFESPLDDFPKKEALVYKKSLLRIANMIDEMVREVS